MFSFSSFLVRSNETRADLICLFTTAPPIHKTRHWGVYGQQELIECILYHHIFFFFFHSHVYTRVPIHGFPASHQHNSQAEKTSQQTRKPELFWDRGISGQSGTQRGSSAAALSVRCWAALVQARDDLVPRSPPAQHPRPWVPQSPHSASESGSDPLASATP